MNPEPQAGWVALYGRQEYRLVGTRPYRSPTTGRHTSIAIWESECATCARTFKIETWWKYLPTTRRCPEHARPWLKNYRQRWKRRKRQGSEEG